MQLNAPRTDRSRFPSFPGVKNETRRRGGLSDAAVGVRPCSGPDAGLLMKEYRARIVADGTGVFRRVDGESGLRQRDGRKRRHGC